MAVAIVIFLVIIFMYLILSCSKRARIGFIMEMLAKTGGTMNKERRICQRKRRYL